jgi:hypothetical protein
MKHALIAPQEGNRLCQVEADAFPVAPPLHWVECADDVSAETHDYVDGEFVVKPPRPPAPSPVVTQASGVEEM